MTRPTTAIWTMSLGLAYPDLFEQYVEVWWDAIRRMDPKPDQIVIAYYEPDTAGITMVDERLLPAPLKAIPFKPLTRIADLINGAIKATDTDWFVCCPMDDLMLPDALSEIELAEDAGAELLVTGVQFTSGGDWIGKWQPEKLFDTPTIPAHSPIRKSAWERVGGYEEMQYHEWSLWFKFAKYGIKTYQGTKPTAIYHTGEKHLTRSGVQFTGHEQAKAEVMEYARSIGFNGT